MAPFLIFILVVHKNDVRLQSREKNNKQCDMLLMIILKDPWDIPQLYFKIFDSLGTCCCFSLITGNSVVYKGMLSGLIFNQSNLLANAFFNFSKLYVSSCPFKSEHVVHLEVRPCDSLFLQSCHLIKYN